MGGISVGSNVGGGKGGKTTRKKIRGGGGGGQRRNEPETFLEIKSQIFKVIKREVASLTN